MGFKKNKRFVILLIILLTVILIANLFIKYKNTTTNNTEQFTIPTIDRTEVDVYVINLEKNKERLELITQQYNDSDLGLYPFIRIEAINGNEINVQPYVTERVYKGILDIDKNNGERHHHSQMTRGAIGCYLSHLKIYEKCKESTTPYALILEDDAVFNNDIYESAIHHIQEQIPSDWDIILLGKIDIKTIKHDTYLEMQEFWGTHGYLINQNGIRKMLDYANIPIDDQIDAIMSKLEHNKMLKIYAPNQEYISQNITFSSEVQRNITEKEGIDPNMDPYK